MSFSSNIKQELNKNSNLSNKEIVKNELLGYLISGNTNVVKKKEIKFSTESDYNINRLSKLLSNLDINHKIEISRKKLCNHDKNKRHKKSSSNQRGANIFTVKRQRKRREQKSNDKRSLYGSGIYKQSTKRISFRNNLK